MYDKKELDKILKNAGIDKSSELVPYFEKQLEKGYRKYGTNDLEYVTSPELRQHLLEELIDAIVYLTNLKQRLQLKSMYCFFKNITYTIRLERLKGMALDLIKNEKGFLSEDYFHKATIKSYLKDNKNK